MTKPWPALARSMVVLPIAPVLAAQADFDSRPFPRQLAVQSTAAFRQMGYAVVPAAKRRKDRVRNDRMSMDEFDGLSRKGDVVDLYVHGGWSAKEAGPGNPPHPVDRIELSVELRLAKEPPIEPSPAEVNRHAVNFRPHLGRTVDVSYWIGVRPGTTNGQVRAGLATFWKAVDGYLERRGSGFVVARGSSARDVPPSTVLRGFDEVSIERIADSFGWKDGHPLYLGIRPIWGYGVRVKGVAFDWIENMWSKGLNASTGFSSSTSNPFALRPSIDPARWASDAKKRFPWMKTFVKGRKADVSFEVAFDKPTTVADLRRRIEAAAGFVNASKASPRRR